MSQQFDINDLNFDVVIPTFILLNRNLEPNAKVLYAFIKGLTRAHGYCFATNGYLAKLMESDESSVKRWISSLKEQEFIEIETVKDGIYWHRHIYLALDLKKCLRRLNFELPPVQKRAGDSSEMSHIIEKKIKEEKETSTPPTPSKGDGDDPFKKSLTNGLKDKEKVERALAFYTKYKARIDAIADNVIAYLVHAIKNEWDKNPNFFKTHTEENRDFARKVLALDRRNEIELLPEAILFKGIGAAPDRIFEFKDPAFQAQVIARLKLMGYDAELA